MNIARDVLNGIGFVESPYFSGFFTIHTDDGFYITAEKQHSANKNIDKKWHVRFFKDDGDTHTKICSMYALETVDELRTILKLLNIGLSI